MYLQGRRCETALTTPHMWIRAMIYALTGASFYSRANKSNLALHTGIPVTSWVQSMAISQIKNNCSSRFFSCAVREFRSPPAASHLFEGVTARSKAHGFLSSDALSLVVGDRRERSASAGFGWRRQRRGHPGHGRPQLRRPCPGDNFQAGLRVGSCQFPAVGNELQRSLHLRTVCRACESRFRPSNELMRHFRFPAYNVLTAISRSRKIKKKIFFWLELFFRTISAFHNKNREAILIFKSDFTARRSWLQSLLLKYYELLTAFIFLQIFPNTARVTWVEMLLGYQCCYILANVSGCPYSCWLLKKKRITLQSNF